MLYLWVIPCTNADVGTQAGPKDAADFVGRAPVPAFHLLREKEP